MNVMKHGKSFHDVASVLVFGMYGSGRETTTRGTDSSDDKNKAVICASTGIVPYILEI